MGQFKSLTLNHVSKRYKKASRDSITDINLNIKAGERIGVLGPNGAGKSTLISIITGILEPTNGSVGYENTNGQPIDRNSRKQLIGYVPQEYALFEELTLDQNINFFGALHAINKENLKEKADELLKAFDLIGIRKKRIKTYSGGMKRRVNLILSLIHEPEILFLDEPTAGVDVQHKQAIINYLKKLSNEGTTLIYTSHHMDEAQEICDRIVMLNKGKMVVNKDLNQLFKDYPKQSLTELFITLTETEKNE